MNEIYFFDTYALFEILSGDKNYEKYADAAIVTCMFNLAELNYGLKKSIPPLIADEKTARFERFLVEVKMEDITKAMSLKTKYKDMSIPDTIGYTIAKRIGIKFLTGDEDFRKLDNVEFVKRSN